MAPDSPTPARIALGLVAAMALSIPFGLSLHGAHNLALLERTGQWANGVVIKKNCENHGKFFYSYEVNGRSYRGVGTIAKPCEDMKVGDPIDIIYSTERPQLSMPESVRSWREHLAVNAFVLSLLGLGAAIVIFRITSVDVAGCEAKK